MSGTVHLVGVGAGDSRSITVRAADILSRADTIVLSPGASSDILQYCRPGVEVLASPEPRADALRRMADQGAAVACVFTGDPMLEPAGAALARELMRARCEFEVVPGLPIALVAAAYGGYPLAQGGHSCVLLVLSSREGEEERHIVTERVIQMASAGEAVLVQTNLERVPRILDEMLARGMVPTTPVALVESPGTSQTILEGRLGEMSERRFSGDESTPAVVIFGKATGAGPRSSWLDRRPLAGRSIVVTRPRTQSTEFIGRLEELGAKALAVPTIQIADPTNFEPLRAAARDSALYDWIVFASANGVDRFWRVLRECGLDARNLAGVSICAIGPKTAEAVAREGVLSDLIAGQAIAESVVEALVARGAVAGKRILLPRAEAGREVLPRGLRELGARVDEVAAYRTIPDEAAASWLRDELEAGRVDMVTFTSSSTARNFARLVTLDLGAVEIASIGPITSQTIREMGWAVAVEAGTHTTEGLCEAIVDHYTRRGETSK